MPLLLEQAHLPPSLPEDCNMLLRKSQEYVELWSFLQNFQKQLEERISLFHRQEH